MAVIYKPIILNSGPHSAASGVETKRNQRRSQNQPTRYYDQAPAMNWDHAVSWGCGVWVSVSDIGRVGSGWPLGRVGQDKTEPETHTKSAHTVLRPSAAAMNWDHAVSWGRRVSVSVSDIGRVGQPELKQSLQAIRGKKKICCAVN